MKKEPLYRKVNTKARGVHHFFGNDFRYERNTKIQRQTEATHQSMHGRKKRGLDYTPLFKFLLSNVGNSWNNVYSEAIWRLDNSKPIFWIVAIHDHKRQDYFRISDSSYYSGLFVNEKGILQAVNPAINETSLTPDCHCCTHTFNGIRFTKKIHRLYSN